MGDEKRLFLVLLKEAREVRRCNLGLGWGYRVEK